MNYKIVKQWVDDHGNRWFTVAFAGGRQSTHMLPVGAYA